MLDGGRGESCGLPSSTTMQAKASMPQLNGIRTNRKIKSGTGLLSFSCFYCSSVVLPVVPNPIGLKTGYSN